MNHKRIGLCIAGGITLLASTIRASSLPPVLIEGKRRVEEMRKTGISLPISPPPPLVLEERLPERPEKKAVTILEAKAGEYLPFEVRWKGEYMANGIVMGIHLESSRSKGAREEETQRTAGEMLLRLSPTEDTIVETSVSSGQAKMDLPGATWSPIDGGSRTAEDRRVDVLLKRGIGGETTLKIAGTVHRYHITDKNTNPDPTPLTLWISGVEGKAGTDRVYGTMRVISYRLEGAYTEREAGISVGYRLSNKYGRLNMVGMLQDYGKGPLSLDPLFNVSVRATERLHFTFSYQETMQVPVMDAVYTTAQYRAPSAANLPPQREKRFRVEARGDLTNGALLVVGMFNSHYDDFHSFSPSADGLYRAETIPSVSTRGWDVETNIPLDGRFMLRATLTYTDVVTPHDLPFVARWRSRMEIFCRFKRFNMRASSSLLSPRSFDPAGIRKAGQTVVTTVRLEYATGNRDAAIFVEGTFLDGDRDIEADGYPHPSTAMTGGIRLRF